MSGVHSDLLYPPRQNVDNKSEIYTFEIPVISGLQICLQKNPFSALHFQSLQLRKTWDSNLLSLDNVYYYVIQRSPGFDSRSRRKNGSAENRFFWKQIWNPELTRISKIYITFVVNILSGHPQEVTVGKTVHTYLFIFEFYFAFRGLLTNFDSVSCYEICMVNFSAQLRM